MRGKLQDNSQEFQYVGYTETWTSAVAVDQMVVVHLPRLNPEHVQIHQLLTLR